MQTILTNVSLAFCFVHKSTSRSPYISMHSHLIREDNFGWFMNWEIFLSSDSANLIPKQMNSHSTRLSDINESRGHKNRPWLVSPIDQESIAQRMNGGQRLPVKSGRGEKVSNFALKWPRPKTEKRSIVRWPSKTWNSAWKITWEYVQNVKKSYFGRWRDAVEFLIKRGN